VSKHVAVRRKSVSLGCAVLCLVLAGTVAAQAQAGFDLVCPMSGELSDGRPAGTFTHAYSVDVNHHTVCYRTKGVCGVPAAFSTVNGKFELYTFSPAIIVKFSAEFDPATNELIEKTGMNTNLLSVETGRCKRQPFTPFKQKRPSLPNELPGGHRPG
jgi:hypothetical protein